MISGASARVDSFANVCEADRTLVVSGMMWSPSEVVGGSFWQSELHISAGDSTNIR